MRPFDQKVPTRRLVIDGRRLVAGRTGVGRYLESLLIEWARDELPASEVVIALADRSGLERVPQAIGMKAVVVAAGLPGLLWERFGLAKLLRPNDLLFAPTNLVPWGWNGRTVLVMFDALQEVRPDDFPRLLRWRFGSRYRRSLAKADRIIVPSHATATDLERTYGIAKDRLTVIHPAPDRSFLDVDRRALEIVSAWESAGLDSQPFFLFVGKKSKRRNVEAILQAYRMGRTRFPDASLVFVGDSHKVGEQEGIIELGHVSDATLRGLLGSATALLYPSEHEGFGLPIVEAMASGCPVITLRRDALIEAGGDGPIYLENADPASLAAAMAAMANDPVARASRIEAGHHAALRFLPETFADEVRRELRRALDS